MTTKPRVQPHLLIFVNGTWSYVTLGKAAVVREIGRAPLIIIEKLD